MTEGVCDCANGVCPLYGSDAGSSSSHAHAAPPSPSPAPTPAPPAPAPASASALAQQVAQWNQELAGKSAQEIIAWTIATFGARHTALSSSFGIQSAVMLHLVRFVTEQDAHRVPVVWIDTGYLPRETYQFAAELENRWQLDLRVYQPQISPARMEALYGKLWEANGAEAHFQYGRIRKVEPMQRAIHELKTRALLVGVRAQQTSHRRAMQIVNLADGYIKVCPILDWSDERVDEYMGTHNLPYHPLKAQGYTTVGDWHSSRPSTDANGNDTRSTRFNGVAQECGLHLDVALVNSYRPSASLASPPPASPPSEQSLLQKARREDGCVIFSKPTCKFCIAAKALLQEHSLHCEDYTVGTDVSLPTLERIVGHSVSTVPQIFLNGKYVGGYVDLCSTWNLTPKRL